MSRDKNQNKEKEKKKLTRDEFLRLLKKVSGPKVLKPKLTTKIRKEHRSNIVAVIVPERIFIQIVLQVLR